MQVFSHIERKDTAYCHYDCHQQRGRGSGEVCAGVSGKQVIGSYEASEKETEILKQIEACQKKLMELMETGMKDGQGDFEQEY